MALSVTERIFATTDSPITGDPPASKTTTPWSVTTSTEFPSCGSSNGSCRITLGANLLLSVFKGMATQRHQSELWRHLPQGCTGQQDRVESDAVTIAMDQQPDSYRIRLALWDEIPRLREIEDEAGTIFSGLGLIDEALDVSLSQDDLARLVGMGQVWVGCLEHGLPVGMVIASVREGAVYVEEMDVLPGHGRRGLGARLLASVCAWAHAQGHAAVTLSTFRDVPWNGPFYRKHGFRDLQLAEWTPGMRAIREKEARHGLCVEARVFMRRELGWVGLPGSPGAGGVGPDRRR